MGKVTLFRPGTGDAIDPAHIFKRPLLAPTLRGGGEPGYLTRVGLQQAHDLGTELRDRYVDPQATTSAAVNRGYLLPRPWESARRLVSARSTRVERT
eukprot:196262-Prymnesium_polylepis.1